MPAAWWRTAAAKLSRLWVRAGAQAVVEAHNQQQCVSANTGRTRGVCLLPAGWQLLSSCHHNTYYSTWWYSTWIVLFDWLSTCIMSSNVSFYKSSLKSIVSTRSAIFRRNKLKWNLVHWLTWSINGQYQQRNKSMRIPNVNTTKVMIIINNHNHQKSNLK